MKKIIACLLSLLLLLSITGCKTLTDAQIISAIENTSIITEITDGIDSTVEEIGATQSTSTVTESKPTASSEPKKTVVPATPTEGSDGSNTPTPDPVAPPTPSAESDATQANTNRLNDILEEQITEGSTVTQEQIDKILNEQIVKDGVVHYNPENFNDTVSMVNLYYQPIEGKFNALDRKVLASLKAKVPEEIYTGIPYNEAGGEEIQEYSSKSLLRFGIKELTLFANDKEFIIDTTSIINRIKEIENTSYYKNIQGVIAELGIYKGMLQRDAIEKFNEYICGKVKYDFKTYAFSLQEFFDEGKAICNSYAQVFEILCRTVGINAEFVGGNVAVSSGNELHAWNRVKLSGVWVYFDICWNDSEMEIYGQIFQKTDRYMYVESFNDRNADGDDTCQFVGYYEFKKRE